MLTITKTPRRGTDNQYSPDCHSHVDDRVNLHSFQSSILPVFRSQLHFIASPKNHVRFPCRTIAIPLRITFYALRFTHQSTVAIRQSLRTAPTSFQNNHSSRSLERAGFQNVDIQAAGHDFTVLVPAIPIGGAFAGQVVPPLVGPRDPVLAPVFLRQCRCERQPEHPTPTDKAATSPD